MAARREGWVVLLSLLTLTAATYQPSRIPFLPQVDFSADGPQRVWYVPNLITSNEAEMLVETAEPIFTPSGIMPSPGEQPSSQGDVFAYRRQSLTANLEDSQLASLFGGIEFLMRIHDVTPWPINHGELLQVTRYNHGGYYSLHFDSSNKVGRDVTVLVFLDDLDEEDGGHTVFPTARLTVAGRAKMRMIQEGRSNELLATSGFAPKAEIKKQRRLDRVAQTAAPDVWDEKQLPPFQPGITARTAHLNITQHCLSPLLLRFSPRAGDAIVWHNHRPDAIEGLDRGSIHGGCPVRTPGKRKHVAQRWIRWKLDPAGSTLHKAMTQCGMADIVHSPQGVDADTKTEAQLLERLGWVDTPDLWIGQRPEGAAKRKKKGKKKRKKGKRRGKGPKKPVEKKAGPEDADL